MPPDRPSVRLCSDVRYQRVADEGVVVRQDAGEVLVLNEVGTRILVLLDQGLSRQQIVERLHEEFDAEPQRLGDDLEAFVYELRASGIIAEHPGP
jgi:hypothetical protein